ncbi:MAG: hypothetical protein ACYTFI_05115 [Planctomycetota bacterium]|jgi:hypothetical protein
MSGSTRRASFLLLALLVPRAALACGACVDQGVSIWLPFAPAFMVLCLAWIISIIVMRNIIRRRTSAKASEMPWRKALVAFELLATVGFVGVVFLSMGSVLGASLVIGTIWVGYIAVKVISALRRRARRQEVEVAAEAEPEPSSRAEQPAGPVVSPRAQKAFFKLNSIFLALALLSIPSFFAYARSTRRMIALLSYKSSGTESVLIPGLIGKGKAAVGPLIDASRQALEARSGPRQTWILNGTLFCLGRIGGADAEAFLSKVVAERVDFQDNMDSEWQKTACLAYAECAGGRAVPVLVGVYQRCETAKVDDARKAVLAALSKTGSKEGTAFVREHE